MADELEGDDTTEFYLLDDGYAPKLGCHMPDVLRFAAVPTWAEANEVLPESQWEEHDDFAPYCKRIEAQANNNCTNSSLADAMVCAFKAAGVEDVPDLSWSFLYALSNGGRDSGASCRDVVAKAMSIGLAPRSVYPDDKIYTPRGGMPREVLAEAAKWQLLEVYQCMNWQDVGSALTRRFEVYHGFQLGNDYTKVRSDGEVPEWSGSYRNGHAMWSRGLRRRGGVWRTITPNTWGVRWGDGGVGYWPKSYYWAERGNRVGLDAYAIRAVRRADSLPVAA
jgi:hypothetical protein